MSRHNKMLAVFVSANHRYVRICVLFLSYRQFYNTSESPAYKLTFMWEVEVPGEKAAKPVTTVPDYVSTFRWGKSLDMFDEMSGHFPALYAATEWDIIDRNFWQQSLVFLTRIQDIFKLFVATKQDMYDKVSGHFLSQKNLLTELHQGSRF